MPELNFIFGAEKNKINIITMNTNSNNQKAYKLLGDNNISMLPGNLQMLLDESFLSKETLVFVDETFLEKLSKHFGQGKYLKFDKISFLLSLAKKQSLMCKKIFYYTAPPFQSPTP